MLFVHLETLVEKTMSGKDPWYKEGLRFKCTGCGKCCTGSPGYVWVNEEEIAAMALFLEISPSDFCKKYVRKAHNRLALIELKPNHDCVFLRDKKCLVYGARPTQCKTFPFWPEHLKSKEAWESVKNECEGISEECDLIDQNQIEETHLIQIKRNNCC